MMQAVDYNEGKKFVEEYNCQCGAPLTLPWGGAYGINGHVLRCGENPEHTGIVKKLTYYSAYKQGYAVPVYIADIIKDKERSEMVEELGSEKATVLAPYQGITSLTQEQAKVILKTIWPEAPDVEVFKAALTCQLYGLNPLMKHLYLIPFIDHKANETKWERVLGIGATRLLASRKCNYGYSDGPRRMKEDEQRDLFGEVDNTKIWAITVLQGPSGNKAPGYGSWPKDQEPKGTNKGNTKLNMAMIRSERNAFDRLLPGEMPADMDVVDTQYTPLVEETTVAKSQQRSKRTLEKAVPNEKATEVALTLDDIDALSKIPDDLFVEQPPLGEMEASGDVLQEEPIYRDASVIQTHNDFCRACHQDFALQPTDALQKSGYKVASEVRNWPEAYMNVAGIMGRRVIKPEDK